MAIKFKPRVTCIVPVYNSEKYLEQGIESLLRQSYKNLEIILVDDHSTDRSWEICENYAKRYKNIVVLKTKQNSGGPLEGRRVGIKAATGEWITFMDHDDYVKKDYVKHLLEGTEHGKYDISVTGHSLLHEDGRIEDFQWDDYSQSTEERLNEFYKHFIRGNYHTDPTDTIGQNLVRSELAKNTRLDHLPNNIYAEDTIMSLSFLANSKNGVNFVNHHDFIWRQVPGSGSHGGFYRRADRNAFYDACSEIFARSDVMAKLDSSISKVSVVVPIYNVEKYLAKCLDSILNQTYTNIEVILVDDKTPDNSGEIADGYAKNDNRVRVIHKSNNEGLNMARATGFEASTGTYVMFVDSDDIIARDCIEFALRAIVKNKAEFAKFNLLTFSNEKTLPEGLNSIDELGEEKVFSGKRELFRSRFENKIVGVSRVTVWGGLYPREIVGRIDWKKSNYRQHEDMYWTMQFLDNVNKGVFISRIGYFYRIDESHDRALSKSLSGNTFNGNPVGYLEFADNYSKEIQEYNKRYKLEIDDEIDRFTSWQWVDRLSKASKAGILTAENNIKYLPTAIDTVVTSYHIAKKKIAEQGGDVNRLRAENEIFRFEIKKLREENLSLKNKVQSFMSVKRSARLLLGNVKRKMKAMLK